MKAISRSLFVATILGITFAGCGSNPQCPEPVDGQHTIVLTFDDGPIRADLSNPADSLEPEKLLAPLREIVAKLGQRNLLAVFYIKGPGDPSAGEALKETYAAGLTLIRENGHVLGYHAYDHTAAIWVEPLVLPVVVEDRMADDLDLLVSYLDEVLAPAGSDVNQIFTPIFRPPFGSFWISELAARQVARTRGWTFHGFRIDSLDWTTNADADPRVAARLKVATEADNVAYVLQVLRKGCLREGNCASIDVLMHVNAFTASHLDEWLDELTSASQEKTGSPPSFDVPPSYLEHDDPREDLSLLMDLLRGN